MDVQWMTLLWESPWLSTNWWLAHSIFRHKKHGGQLAPIDGWNLLELQNDTPVLGVSLGIQLKANVHFLGVAVTAAWVQGLFV
jgi:hypothetical protein